MSYTRLALALPFARFRSHDTLVDLFAERGIGAYRVQNQRFACLWKVVLGESQAGRDSTRKASREPLSASSNAGEIRRVHPQPAAEFPKTDTLFDQESRERVAERLVGPNLRHGCSLSAGADAYRPGSAQGTPGSVAQGGSAPDAASR